MRCVRGTFLVAAISVTLVSSPSTAKQAEDQRPSGLAQAEWAATGGHGWDRIAAVILEGTMTEGGVPGRFEKTIDLRTGNRRMLQETGPMRAVTGYDGVTWNAANGIVNSVDLPPLVEDARSQAFVDRAGWRSETGFTISKAEQSKYTEVVHYLPAGGSEVEVTFDLTDHLVRQVVVQTEDGPLTITYSNWRRVGNVSFPFREVEISNTGETTTFEIKRVRVLSRLPPDALARPTRSPHGRLVSVEGARISFRYAGSHILVSALVNDVPSDVVFDTGAANYFSPTWSEQFGLKVSGGLNLSGPGESSTAGGYAVAKRISLGSAELSDQVVMVGPVPWDARPGQPGAAGTVGFEFLAEFRTTIDYPAQTISFAEFGQRPAPKDAGTTVPFSSDGHSIYIEAEVDGHRGLFRLDTGDGGTVTLFPAFAKRHDLYQGTGEDVVSGAGVGGKVRARKVTLSHFKLAGADFRELPANLSQNKAGSFASRTVAGNLGGGVLRCYRITFDYPARFLTFQADPEHLRDCVKVH